MKFLVKVCLLLSSLLLLSACDKDDPLFIVSGKTISVTPFESSIIQGSSKQFKAILIDEEGEKQDVTDLVNWSSSDVSVASISASGGLANGLAVGDSSIIATLDNVSGSAALNVNNKTISVVSISPNRDLLIVGLTQQYTAIAQFNDNTTQDITQDADWLSLTSAVASIDAATGIATALTTGTSQIEATFNSITGSAQLAVSTATVSAFIIQPSTSTVLLEEQQQYQAMLLLNDNTTIDVTQNVLWAALDPTVAVVSNVSAKKGLGVGVNIGATSVLAVLNGVNNVTFATPATITVKAVELESVNILSGDISVAKGTAGYLQAVAYYSDGSNVNVSQEASWLSSNPIVAFVEVSGRNAGFAYARNEGESTIKVRFGGKEDSVLAEVTAATVESIQIVPADESVALGLSVNYTATALLSDNSKADVTNIAHWSTANQTIAVSNPRVLGRVDTLSTGTTMVTANVAGVSSSANINVTAATLSKIIITPPDADLSLGFDLVYHADAIFSDNTHIDISKDAVWTSNDMSVLSFNLNIASSQSVGNTTVNALFAGSVGSTPVTVSNPTFRKLEIAPQDKSIALGLTVQYQASATFSVGSPLNVTHFVDWQSSEPSIAVIDENGLMHTKANGLTTIKATLENGATATAILAVSDAALVSLIIVPEDLTYPVGIIQQYSAIAEFTDKGLMDVTREAAWRSSSPAVAVVGNFGFLTGKVLTLSAGSANISANYAGFNSSLESQTSLTVIANALTNITVSCEENKIDVDTNTRCRAVGEYGIGGRKVNITDQVTWLSSNDNFLTVSNEEELQGLVHGINIGTANITAIKDAVTSNAVAIEVAGLSLTSVSVTSENNVLVVQYPEAFTATANYSDGTNVDVTQLATWSSSDEAVLVMSNVVSGNGSPNAVGSADAIASFDNVSGLKSITVISNVSGVESLTVQCTGGPASRPTELNVGDTTKCFAQVVFDDGTSEKVTADTTWTIDDGSVLRNNGLANPTMIEVEAIGVGETLLRANYLGVESTHLIIVD